MNSLHIFPTSIVTAGHVTSPEDLKAVAAELRHDPQPKWSNRENSVRDSVGCGVSRDESGERIAAESKQNTQRTRNMKTFKLTLVALVAAATSALVVNAGTPNILLSPRAAQAQPTVVTGAGADQDYVHGTQTVGSPRGLAFAASLRPAPGMESDMVQTVAVSTVSPRAAVTFPWLKIDPGMHDTSAFAACKTVKKGECKMNCCSTATVCPMPCCKS